MHTVVDEYTFTRVYAAAAAAAAAATVGRAIAF